MIKIQSMTNLRWPFLGLSQVRRAYFEFDCLGGGDAGCSFARDRLLSIKTLQQMASLKRQLLEALSSAGLGGDALPPGLRQNALERLGRRAGRGGDGVRAALGQWQDERRRLIEQDVWKAPPPPPPASAELLAALVGAALFPQVWAKGLRVQRVCRIF